MLNNLVLLNWPCISNYCYELLCEFMKGTSFSPTDEGHNLKEENGGEGLENTGDGLRRENVEKFYNS